MSDENNFKPEMGTYKPLRPFNLFMKNNFPFIENTFEALDTYGLLCEIVKYLNIVIENTNTTEENVTALSNAFNQLNDYVSHYFDNLDVQEEINNKLDEMATTGVLQSMVDDYFSYVTNLIAAQNRTISSQTGTINELSSRMDSFTNLTSGSTTGDAELIDGRVAFDGRTYANIGGNIRNNQKVFWEDITSTLTSVDGKYILKGGTEGTSDSFMYYKLETDKDYDYYIDTYSTSLAAQVYLGYNDTIPAASDISSSSGPYTDLIYLNGTGNTVYINKLKSQYCHIYQLKKVNNISDISTYFRKLDISTETTKTEGKYINYRGVVNTASTYNLYTFTPKKGHVYIIKTNATDYAPVCYQNQPIPYNRTVSYNFIKGMYYYVCTSNSQISVNEYATGMRLDTVEIYESHLPIFTDHSYISYNGMISNGVFIGDSLTYGQTYTAANTSYRNYYNYPYFMKKLYQLDTIEEYARGGATATSWWSQFNEDITATNSVYFVWLGTNSTFTDTVSTDCEGDDYTEYATTETGYMGKILGKIASLSGNKIVLLNNFATSGTLATNNKVIQDFATKFNAILVNVNTTEVLDTKYHTAYNDYYNSVHFNDLGHNYIANLVKNTLDEKINETDNIIELYKEHA